jgi:hypothetical protein
LVVFAFINSCSDVWVQQQHNGPYLSTITPTDTTSNVPNMEQGDIDMFFKRHKWVKFWGRTSDSLPKGDKGKSPKVQNIPKIDSAIQECEALRSVPTL